MDVAIGIVKQSHDTGIVVGSNKDDSITQLKATAEKELSAKYEVHLLKPVHHQICLGGLFECCDNDTFKVLLRKQNSDIFSINFDFNVVRTWPTKKMSSKFFHKLILKVLFLSFLKSTFSLVFMFVLCMRPSIFPAASTVIHYFTLKIFV